MRPVELVMQGFGPFRDPVTVDFADAELIAIVGATGHGKSSIIDAICFALYGRVPRHGDKDLAPVITLGAAETRVALTFTLGAHRYSATRLVRRNPDGAGAKTRAVRLEQVNDDGSTEVLAGSVREFDPKLRALLGLDFDQFTKCVVLPQGRFAAFLQATSGERSAILGALLGLSRYERMARAARDRAGRAQGLREALEQERSRGAGLDEPALDAERTRRDALADLLAEIDGARDHDAQLGARIDELGRDADAVRSSLAVLARVRVDDAIGPLALAIAAATKEREAAVAAAEAADRQAIETADALDRLPALEALTAAQEAHAEHETLATRIANGAEIQTRLTGETAAARDALVAAQRVVDDAEAVVDDANRKHAHAELRAGLVAGEPCPVCEQVVSALPPKVSTAAAGRARKARDAARTQLRKQESAASALLETLHKADAQLESLRDRQAEVATKIAAHPDRAALEVTIDDVRARRGAAQAARADLSRHREAVAVATRTVDDAVQKVASAEQTFQAQRDALLGVGMTPPTNRDPSLPVRWEALAGFAADQQAVAEKQVTLVEEQAAALSTERASLFGALRTRATALGTDPQATALSELTTAVTGAHRDAVHAVEQAEARLARVAELDRDIAAARGDEQVAQVLGRLLDGRHFRQWIVDEALRGLVDGASVVFRNLSSGQYSLAVTNDADLLVVDHVNADETRSVNSLSGGETFQASLALALALADRISELAGDNAEPLESIFLDEGFGSLDPETLDVVAGTIESLARHDRIVGVVTHVRELADRMPVRFRVRKESGTSVVTREES
jgi:DNA repair protein SbcC/Rad50